MFQVFFLRNRIHFAVYGLVVGLVTAYQLSCPDKSQRRFLQQNCPSSSSYYTCLFNVISKRNETDCFPRDYLVKEGFKKIRMPGITDANCSKDRYQPTTFYASQFSECMYLKSGCEEEGQVVVSDGTGSQDRSCRCDYRAGYTYVIPPRNQCACVPSEEDCSCRKMYCKQNEALSPDYKCEKTGGLFLTVCQRISTTVPPGDEAIVLDQLDPLPLSNTPSHISGSQASLGVLLPLFVVIMVVALLWLRVCPEIKSYNVNFEKTNHVIHEDDINHRYTVINGCDLKLTLTYKSLLPIRQIILRNVSSGQMLKGKKETEVTSGQMLKGKVVRAGWWGVKETSYHVCTLQTTSTGNYDIIIINMIGLPSSLMDWWNRCHARLVNFIYNQIDDKTKTSINKTELIIVSLPERYTPKDIIRGQAVTLELKESEYSLVSWLRLDDNDQLSVVNNDSTQPDKRQKYTGGVSSNPSLTINQTCMGDGSRYCCFVVPTDGEMTCYCWKLRVIPQEHGYKELKAHKSDTEYVRTSVVSKAMGCLKRNGVVVIKGREGTGKTKLTLDLASIWEEKGYIPVIVRSVDDVTKEFDESNILYIFDHSNGNEKYWIDKLKQCLLQKKSDLTCKAVFMVRNVMFGPLKELKTKEDAVVDLDKGLLEDDKLSILTLYMEKNNIATVGSEESNFSQKEIIEDHSLQVKLDRDSVRMIIKTDPILGFPLMAKQFCTSRTNLHIGEKYFKIPPKSIIQKIAESTIKAREKSAGHHEAMKVVVLAYVTMSDNQSLNINDIKFDTLTQINSVLFKEKPVLTDLSVAVKEKIQKAADSLVGDYLTCSYDGVYEFIHPYYSKAVVLSSHDFASIIVNRNRLELVLEFVRGDRGQKDDSVIRLAETYYPDLCVQLIKKFFQHSTLTAEDKTCDNIGNYIYNYWIKDRDVKFCSDLVKKLEQPVIGERERGDKVLPLHVFSLLKYMTSNWNDLWIYSTEVIQDVLIIYGLLALYKVKTKNIVSSEDKKDTDTYSDATQNTGTVDKMQYAVNVLKFKLKERLEGIKSPEDNFPGKLGIPLDQHGNTFFHYLILYEDEKLACIIFNICSKYVKKEWTAENTKGNRPIDLAVAFGRPKLCKAFIVEYEANYARVVLKNKEEWQKEKKERLKTILNSVQSGDPKPTGPSNPCKSSKKDGKNKKEDIAINSNENFHPDIARLVLSGSKEDYKALSDILIKL